MSKINKKQSLIWIDLEMTGLVPETDRIIEIATLITDGDLNVIAQGPVLAVKQSDEALAAMDDWNQRTHGNSGLIERVKNSTISELDAQAQTLAFLSEYSEKGALRLISETSEPKADPGTRIVSFGPKVAGDQDTPVEG